MFKLQDFYWFLHHRDSVLWNEYIGFRAPVYVTFAFTNLYGFQNESSVQIPWHLGQ